MPIDTGELKKRCQAAAEAHIAELLEGTHEFVPGEPDSAWDPILHRQIFTQPFVIWRNAKEVEIGISPQGTIRSFRDQSRFEGAKYEPLTASEVLSICQTTGLISWAAQVHSTLPAPAEMLAAVILDNN